AALPPPARRAARPPSRPPPRRRTPPPPPPLARHRRGTPGPPPPLWHRTPRSGRVWYSPCCTPGGDDEGIACFTWPGPHDRFEVCRMLTESCAGRRCPTGYAPPPGPDEMDGTPEICLAVVGERQPLQG